jgi:membrane glycosyltransferase
MSEELDNSQLQSSKSLPNATAVLVLGILSIVMCWTYGVLGLILGIIAIVLHRKDKEVYATNPAMYEQSFKNSKAGNVCGIIGIVLSVLFLLYVIAMIVFFTTAMATTVGNPEFREAFQQLADTINANNH